jgi:hypothetical protein
MQAKWLVLASACLALALPLRALALAQPTRALAETVEVDLTSLTTIEDPHLAPHGTHPGKGDFVDFRDLLLNRGHPQFGKPAGKPVAWDEGLIWYTSRTTRTIKVLVTFPDIGTILYSGPLVDGPGGAIVPIVRGTGAFKGARGTITIGAGSGSAPNTIHLRVPGHPLDITSGSPAA